MEPKKHTKRTPVPGGDSLDVIDINDTYTGGEQFLEGDDGFLDTMESDTDVQELRIEALKKAIDIAKLMSDVTTEDVINIALLVIKFVKETEI